MFIKSKRSTNNRTGEQRASGKFLCLFSHDKQVYGVVRHCRMRQLGHFMMGEVELGDQRISLSGTYGSDGLPRDLDEVQSWNRHLLTRMPESLEAQLWAGGGHNCAGSEAEAVHAWGLTLTKQPKASVKIGKTENGTAFDSCEVMLPNASNMGHSTYKASPGRMICFKNGDEKQYAIVLGRVIKHKDADNFLVCIMFGSSLSFMYEVWVDPADVEECRAIPTNLFSFLSKLTPEKVRENGEQLLKLAKRGSLSESYIKGEVI